MKFPLCENGQPCFIDPANENPAEHLDFLESQILHKTNRGNKTIQEIGLDRDLLTECRTLWLLNIKILLLLCCSVSKAYSSTKELLIWSMQPDAPYTAMTRQYLKMKAPKLANPVNPHPFIHLANPKERISELIEQYREELFQLE